MKDYSQILSGGGSQQGQNSGRNRQNNQQSFGQGQRDWDSGDQVVDEPTGQQVPKRTKFALANSLGNTAETAKGLGISRRQAHRIVDTAYQGSTRS